MKQKDGFIVHKVCKPGHMTWATEGKKNPPGEETDEGVRDFFLSAKTLEATVEILIRGLKSITA